MHPKLDFDRVAFRSTKDKVTDSAEVEEKKKSSVILAASPHNLSAIHKELSRSSTRKRGSPFRRRCEMRYFLSNADACETLFWCEIKRVKHSLINKIHTHVLLFIGSC